MILPSLGGVVGELVNTGGVISELVISYINWDLITAPHAGAEGVLAAREHLPLGPRENSLTGRKQSPALPVYTDLI